MNDSVNLETDEHTASCDEDFKNLQHLSPEELPPLDPKE